MDETVKNTILTYMISEFACLLRFHSQIPERIFMKFVNKLSEVWRIADGGRRFYPEERSGSGTVGKNYFTALRCSWYFQVYQRYIHNVVMCSNIFSLEHSAWYCSICTLSNYVYKLALLLICIYLRSGFDKTYLFVDFPLAVQIK